MGTEQTDRTAEKGTAFTAATGFSFGGAAWRTCVVETDAAHASWAQARLRSGRMEWGSRGEAVLAPESSAPAGAEAASPAPTPPAVAVKGDGLLQISAAQALLRITDLPSTDPAELRNMVELQADQRSPFPVEQLTLTYEVLETAKNQTRMLIAAMRRDVVEAACARWFGPHKHPVCVDMDLPVWWSVAGPTAPEHPASRQIHLRCFPRHTWLIATRQGVPILMRVLAGGLESEELRDELAGDLSLTLAAMEQEWGAESSEVFLWDAPADGSDGARLLADRLGCGIHSAFTPATFDPAQALLERHSRSDTQPLNLAPKEWGEDRRRRKALWRTGGIAAAAVALWVVVLSGFLVWSALGSASIKRLAGRVAREEKPAAEVKALQERVHALESHRDLSQSALEIMKTVSDALPPGAKLTSFSYRKGKTLQLRAEAPAPDVAYDFVNKLQEHPLFRGVRPEGIVQKSTPGGSSTEFRVTADFAQGES